MVKSYIKHAPTLFLMNRSSGVIPVILCMILSGFLSDSTAIYISLAVGVLILVNSYIRLKLEGATIMAYLSTFMLALFGILTILPNIAILENMLTFYSEIAIVLFESILLVYRKQIIFLFQKTDNKQYNTEMIHILDTRNTSTKLTRLLCIPHILITLILVLFFSPLNKTAYYIQFELLPPVLLLLAWLGNQLFILVLFYFSQKTEKIPIVNENGAIIGKKFSFDVILEKNKYIFPVVRVAIVCKDLLYLRRRSDANFVDPEKTDIPLESYLRYGENIEDGISRVVSKELAFKENETITPKFCIKYLFKNEDTHRLVYLYIAYIDDENKLSQGNLEQGKLWTIRQVETNIGKNFFGECFEQEFKHIKKYIKHYNNSLKSDIQDIIDKNITNYKKALN